MTPDQYRREGAEAMRETCIGAVSVTVSHIVGTPYSAGGRAFTNAIRAIDVDEVVAGMPPRCAECDCEDGNCTWIKAGSDPVAQLMDADTPHAWTDVLDERKRQITVEGWTPEHDDAHEMAEMAQAAACYAISGTPADEAVFIHGRWRDARDLFWPRQFGREWWKPTNRRRDLVKAGALILAEIERLDRAALAQEGGE